MARYFRNVETGAITIVSDDDDVTPHTLAAQHTIVDQDHPVARPLYEETSEAAALAHGGKSSGSAVASAQVVDSVGTLNHLVHGEDITAFVFDQGATSDSDLFGVSSGGIQIKKPGLYHAELSVAVNNLLRGGAAAKLFLLVTLPGDTWVSGNEFDGFNGWMQYGVDAMIEVAEGPQLISCEHAIIGATTDISDNIFTVFSIYRVGDLADRPALASF